MLIYGLAGDTCLEGYTVVGANTIDERVSRVPEKKMREALQRKVDAQSTYAQVDENGRIVLPQKLRERFGLAEEALFAGMGDHFQVWAPEAYAKDMEALDAWSASLPDGQDLFAALDAVDRESRS